MSITEKYQKSSVITVHIHERVNNKYFAQTVHDFTGVELGQIYTVSLFSISDENFYQVSQNDFPSLHQVSLTCVFDERQFDCGTTFLSTAPPALVVGDKVRL